MIKEALDFRPHFAGVSTPEPNLRWLIMGYYLRTFEPNKAGEHTEHYIKLLEAEFDEHG